MNIEKTLNDLAAAQGWNDSSKVTLLLEFIRREHQSNILVGDRFQDFLSEQAEEENSLT